MDNPLPSAGHRGRTNVRHAFAASSLQFAAWVRRLAGSLVKAFSAALEDDRLLAVVSQPRGLPPPSHPQPALWNWRAIPIRVEVETLAPALRQARVIPARR